MKNSGTYGGVKKQRTDKAVSKVWGGFLLEKRVETLDRVGRG